MLTYTLTTTNNKQLTQLTFTCSNSAIETPEKGLKYVQI